MNPSAPGDGSPQTCLEIGPLTPSERAALFIELLLLTAPNAELQLGGNKDGRYTFHLAASTSAIIRAILASSDFVPAAMRSSAGGHLSITLQSPPLVAALNTETEPEPNTAPEVPALESAAPSSEASSDSPPDSGPPPLLGALERLDSAIGALLGQLAHGVDEVDASAADPRSDQPLAASDTGDPNNHVVSPMLSAGTDSEVDLVDEPANPLLPDDKRASLVAESLSAALPISSAPQEAISNGALAVDEVVVETEPDSGRIPEPVVDGVIWEGWHWSTATPQDAVVPEQDFGSGETVVGQFQDEAKSSATAMHFDGTGETSSHTAPAEAVEMPHSDWEQIQATPGPSIEPQGVEQSTLSEDPEKRYRITLGDSCPVCRAVSRISFTADRPPQLPIAGCRDADGCRCELPASMPRPGEKPAASDIASAGAGEQARNGNAPTLRCPECGAANPSGTYYCGRCQEPLLPEMMIPADARRSSRPQNEERAAEAAASTNGHVAPPAERNTAALPASSGNGSTARALPETAEELEEMSKRGQIQIVAHPFANFGRLNQFITMLGDLPGVRSVTLRRFRNGILRLAVDYNGPSPLSVHLRAAKDIPLEIVSESDDLIELTVSDEDSDRQGGQEPANATSRGAISR